MQFWGWFHISILINVYTFPTYLYHEFSNKTAINHQSSRRSAADGFNLIQAKKYKPNSGKTDIKQIQQARMINRESTQTHMSSKPPVELTEELLDESEFIKPTTRQRLNSLDVLRGLTMLGMILVDNQGPSPPWFLDHSEWNGLTPADLVFPSFLFIMGMAVPLSMSPSKPFSWRNLIRILALFGIGVFINLSARKFTFNHFRILGILQRLALCYGLLAVLHWATQYASKTLRMFGTLFAILSGITYLGFMLSFQDDKMGCTRENNLLPDCNFGAYVDQKIFGRFHMIFPNDPEGLFTTTNAFLNSYIGYYFCLIMTDHKNQTSKILKLWTGVSLACVLIGGFGEFLMPLNKKIWSTSFVFMTAGITGFSLTLLTLLVDVLGSSLGLYSKVVRVVTKPFVWLGRNPLIIFILMDVVAILMIKYITISDKSLWAQFYHYAFASWITNETVCSTVFACFFAVVWMAVAGILFKFKIFIRL